MPLNQTHRSDYYFGGEDGKTRQFSRKQAGELLGNIDEAEDQLRDYYGNADENYQIVEGIISPIAITRKDRSLEAISIRKGFSPTNLYSYKVAPNGFLFDEHSWSTSSAMLDAWEHQLEQAGIYTYYRVNWIATAKLMAAIYHNCQKPPEEHSTLQRYIKPRIVLKEHHPFIKALMALSLAYQLNIGEDKATRISTRFSSILDIAMCSEEELCEVGGIGKKTARKLLEAIGREL